MTLMQLRYIITISETGSLNKAADLLYVSQPSLTSSVKELEKELDMEEEKKESFHYYYEKARYGKRECTKEDLQNMMKL